MRRFAAAIGIGIMLVASGCGDGDDAADPEASAPSTAESTPTTTAAPTTTVVSAPTAADTTTTTAAPTTTTTTAPLTSQGFIDSMRFVGLPITESIVFTAENDPNGSLGRPGQYIGKASWLDSRIEECQSDEIGWDCGGDIEVFATDAQRDERYDYLSGFASNPPIGGFYMWRIPGAVVRVGFDLTPDEAATYTAFLEASYPGQVDQYAG